MNIYDFDKTIYKNDSTEEFYFWCLKRHPQIAILLPYQGLMAIPFGLKIMKKTTFKQKFYCFFRMIKNIDEEVDDFVNANIHKIMPWYLKQQQKDDLVISASPEFLIKKFCDKIGINNVIASNVDKYTGKYSGLNCYGEEKVKRYLQQYDINDIDKFYSDSKSDTPLAKISKEAYIVHGNNIKDWD